MNIKRSSGALLSYPLAIILGLFLTGAVFFLSNLLLGCNSDLCVNELFISAIGSLLFLPIAVILSRKYPKVVFFVVVIYLLSILAWRFTESMELSSSVSKINTKANISDLQDVKVFSDDQISFEYPSTWEVHEKVYTKQIVYEFVGPSIGKTSICSLSFSVHPSSVDTNRFEGDEKVNISNDLLRYWAYDNEDPDPREYQTVSFFLDNGSDKYKYEFNLYKAADLAKLSSVEMNSDQLTAYCATGARKAIDTFRTI